MMTFGVSQGNQQVLESRNKIYRFSSVCQLPACPDGKTEYIDSSRTHGPTAIQH